jgi:hypothetical protein
VCVANLGDSRAIISRKQCKIIIFRNNWINLRPKTWWLIRIKESWGCWRFHWLLLRK